MWLISDGQRLTVNGGGLPYVILQVGQDRFEITAGHLQLNADNTFSFSMTTRSVLGGTTATEVDSGVGTWSRTGNQLTFVEAEGTETGVLSGDEITVIDEGVSRGSFGSDLRSAGGTGQEGLTSRYPQGRGSPPGSEAHHNGWEKALAKLARKRARELDRLAEELDG